MPARSKSQQRLFGMVHAYQKGKLKNATEEVRSIARSISEEDAEHFAKTKHKGLPEKKACQYYQRKLDMTHKEAYERGFMDKCAEFGIASKSVIEKSANMPWTVPFKKIRPIINEAIAARKAATMASVGRIVYPEDFIPKSLLDSVRRLFPRVKPIDKHFPDYVLSQGIKGAPTRPVFRGTGLPDMSSGGHTSSNYVRNTGPNIRHITTDLSNAAGYGDYGLVEVYNGRKVPGLFSGRLRFGTNRFVEDVTDGFKNFGALFDKEMSKAEARAIGQARRKALDTRSFDITKLPKFRGATDPGFDDLLKSRGIPKYRAYELVDELNHERNLMLDLWRGRGAGARLGYESAVDTLRTRPSRTYQLDPFYNARDVSSLQEFARIQKTKLPEGFDLGALGWGEKNWWEGLNNQQVKAAKRYLAVRDILAALANAYK